MNNHDVNIGSALLKFKFRDEDGEIISSFRINPADVKLAKRCTEVSGYFEDLHKRIPENATIDDVIKFNDELEEKICYLLGYDAKQSLFGQMSATTIMPDSNLFAVYIVDNIVQAVGPEVKKRQENMAQAVAKHTAKYVK